MRLTQCDCSEQVAHSNLMKQNNDWLLAKAVLLKQRSNMWLPMAVPPNGNTESGLYRFIDDVVVPIPAA